MWRVFSWALGWLAREVVVKFFVLSGLYLLVAFLVPFAVGYLGGFIDPLLLDSAFSSLPPGVWYYLDLFRFDVGLPLALSAMVGRFLIRRLPVIG